MGLHFLTRLVYRRNKSGSQNDTLVSIRQGNATWIVRADWREIILSKDAPDWFHAGRQPKSYLVESGQQRAVWRIDRGDRQIFAKVVHESGLRNRIKAWLLGTHGEREWRTATLASAAGVPIPKVIGVGVRSITSADNVLLTEAFPAGVTLSVAWNRDVPPVDDKRRPKAVRRLIKVVAGLLATAHQRGLAHRDAHPNNILIAANKQDVFEAVFVDTHGSRLGRGPVKEHLAVRNLAHLDQYFHRLATRSERLRFLKTYFSHLTPNRAQTADRGERCRLVAQVTTTRAHHAARLAARRDRRLRKTGRYFARFELGGGWRAFVATILERRHVFPEARVPDRTAAEWRELFAGSLSDAPGFDETVCGNSDGPVRLERTILRGLAQRLRSTITASAHRRAFESCHVRRHRDLPADLVLGYAEHRTGWLVDITILLRPAERES